MKNSGKTILWLLFFGLMAIGCSEVPTSPSGDDGEPEIIAPPVIFDTPQAALINSQNRFGLKLFTSLNGFENPDKNLFISPLSVSMALGMTMNGAVGATREAMEQTLEYQGLSRDEINQVYRDLIDLLTTLDPNVILQMANSIWYRDTFPISPAFVETNRTWFDAEVAGLDFNSPDAVEIINAWVRENTNNKIEEILQEIDPLVMMFLINAVYFKGNWLMPFDPEKTEDGEFHLTDGSSTTVPMMTMREVYFPYHRDNAIGFSAVDLAYGDSLFTMTMLLPDSYWHIDDFIEQLDQAVWDSTITHLRKTRISLFRMPKFRVEYEVDLVDVLTSLGMGIAFDPRNADLSLMTADSSRGLFVSQVRHKTFVEVNEEGTEAAAVTVVVAQLTSGGGYLSIDRPFVFAIRERVTGTILFIGKVVDPS